MNSFNSVIFDGMSIPGFVDDSNTRTTTTVLVKLGLNPIPGEYSDSRVVAISSSSVSSVTPLRSAHNQSIMLTQQNEGTSPVSETNLVHSDHPLQFVITITPPSDVSSSQKDVQSHDEDHTRLGDAVSIAGHPQDSSIICDENVEPQRTENRSLPHIGEVSVVITHSPIRIPRSVYICAVIFPFLALTGLFALIVIDRN